MKCSAQCTPLKAGWGFMGSFTHQRQCLCGAIFRWSGIYDFPEYLECEWVMWAPSVSPCQPRCSLSTVITHYCSHNANRSWRKWCRRGWTCYLKWNETHWCNHTTGEKNIFISYAQNRKFFKSLKRCLYVKLMCNRTKQTHSVKNEKQKKPFLKSFPYKNLKAVVKTQILDFPCSAMIPHAVRPQPLVDLIFSSWSSEHYKVGKSSRYWDALQVGDWRQLPCHWTAGRAWGCTAAHVWAPVLKPLNRLAASVHP